MSYSVDTSSAEYRPTSSVPSVVENGELTFQVCTHFHTRPALRPGELSAADYLAAVEADPRKSAALARARARAGQSVSEIGGTNLAKLRLSAKMSQAQLAAKLGTQQPNVARWERDPKNMTAETVFRFAEALGVNATEVLEATRVNNG